MSENIRRGYVPTDERDFADKRLPDLRLALSDIHEFLDRGYEVKKVSTFVGNHYQLSERQRLALARAATETEKIRMRRQKQKTVPDGTVYIDGLNLIITLESAICGTTVYRCMDGTVRDLAAMRGTYRIIDSTHKAAALVMDKLESVGAESVKFFLDEPVSNSGRLKTLLMSAAEGRRFYAECELVPNADVMLYGSSNAVTSDAIILDMCAGWLNFAAEIIDENLPGTRVINFTGKD